MLHKLLVYFKMQSSPLLDSVFIKITLILVNNTHISLTYFQIPKVKCWMKIIQVSKTQGRYLRPVFGKEAVSREIRCCICLEESCCYHKLCAKVDSAGHM